MSELLMGEGFIPINRVAQKYGLHVATVHRWVNPGVKRNGRRVRLSALRIGRRMSVSVQAVEKFLKELNEDNTAAPTIPTSQAEAKAVAVALAKLDAAGI